MEPRRCYEGKRKDFSTELEWEGFGYFMNSHLPENRMKANWLYLAREVNSLREHLSVLDLEHLRFISENVDGKKNTALRKAELITYLEEIIPKRFRSYLNQALPLAFEHLRYDTGLFFPMVALFGENVWDAFRVVSASKVKFSTFANPDLMSFRGLMVQCGFAYPIRKLSVSSKKDDLGIVVMFPKEILDVLRSFTEEESFAAEKREVLSVHIAAEVAAYLYGKYSYGELHQLLTVLLGQKHAEAISDEKIDTYLSQKDGLFKDEYAFRWKKEEGRYWPPGTGRIRDEVRVKWNTETLAETNYVPTLQSIAWIFVYGLDLGNPAISRAATEISKKSELPEFAVFHLRKWFENVQSAPMSKRTLEYEIDRLGITSPSESLRFKKIIQDFHNAIQRWTNKGYSPEVLLAEQIRMVGGKV